MTLPPTPVLPSDLPPGTPTPTSAHPPSSFVSRWQPDPAASLPAIERPLAIVWRDAHILIVDKPAGLLSVPGRGPEKADCLTERVMAHEPEARCVHRLDMETSGLLVYAIGPQVHRALNLAFEQRRVHKRYLAVVGGLVAGDEGEVNLPLVCDWPARPLQKVCHETGRPALTRWRVLARDAATQRTRVLLEPVTGRTHQLRLHMAALGHPILGDGLYATPAQQAAAPRLLLHAATLALPELPALDLRWPVFESAAPF